MDITPEILTQIISSAVAATLSGLGIKAPMKVRELTDEDRKLGLAIAEDRFPVPVSERAPGFKNHKIVGDNIEFLSDEVLTDSDNAKRSPLIVYPITRLLDEAKDRDDNRAVGKREERPASKRVG